MEDPSLELLTPEQRKLHEEFLNCKTWEEVEEFLKKVEKLQESQEEEAIPHYDMTLEELEAKYHLVSHEKVWGKIMDKLDDCESWTPEQWADYMIGGETFDDEELDRFIEEEIIEK